MTINKTSFISFFILISFVSIFPYNTDAQDSLLAIKAEKIYPDNIGNVYIVENGAVTKFFTNGQSKTFSIKTLGILQSMDVSNTLRILLYFRDFQKILFLDNQLSQNGDVIELSALGLEQASLVCSSFNNGFWVYNQANNELIRFNQQLETNVKTGNLKRLLNKDIRPTGMIEHNGKLYLNSPNVGILVFDIYGAFLKIIPVYAITDFQIQYPYVFYIYKNKYYSFHLVSFETIEVADVPNNCMTIIYNGNYCYWHYSNYIKINQCIK
ncbi:MAG: hypothetical protein N2203_06840 [Bacteroidia bacterium]|nr:hypothetical protein [Bacteroidia bacterium]